jgi:hypothetical protein
MKTEVEWSLLLGQTQRHADVQRTGDLTPCILNLNTRDRIVVNFTPRPLYPRGKMTGIMRRSRSGREEKKAVQRGIETRTFSP